jgi:hypothetical protein
MAAFGHYETFKKLFSDSCRLFTSTWLKAMHMSFNEAQTANKTVLAFGAQLILL